MNENAERNKAFIKRCEDYANEHGYFCWEWFFNGLPEDEDNMAGFLNEQVQEWYKNNTDLLGVIEKLTNRCKKLEEENENLKDENKILKDEFDIKVKVVKAQNDDICKIGKRCGELEEKNTHLKDEVKAAVSREEIARWNLENRTHEVTVLNNCLARKNTTIKELRQKITAITDINALDFNAIFTSLGVNDTRSALDKIMEMKMLIKHNKEENNQLGKKIEDLQEAYDNCVNECSDHVIEIDSLLQNLEVETVEKALDKIKLLKDGCLITFNFSAEADLRVENERLKRRIEDLRKDVQFEYDRRMTELAASTELKETVGKLRQKNDDLCRVLQEETIGRKRAESENAKLKSFIKDRTKDIHEMSEEIEKHLAKYREEKNNE